VQIAAIDRGEGVPLVLLHGIGSNSRSWRRQIEDLSREFRIIAWDAPGYGRSGDPPPATPSMSFLADALALLLDEKQVQRVHLLGHSMGGIVAQEFCRRHAPRLFSLILADTTTGGGPPSRLEERLRMIRTMTPAARARQRAPQQDWRPAPAGGGGGAGPAGGL
jgi:pimeloyl-ACP methyl ester carboxylesterase